MRDFRNFFFISEHERLGREKNSSQTVFSLNYVDGILDGRYDLEDNKSARMYHFIVKLLKGYLPPDKDVLDYDILEERVLEQLSYHIPRYEMGKYNDTTPEERELLEKDIALIRSKVELWKLKSYED